VLEQILEFLFVIAGILDVPRRQECRRIRGEYVCHIYRRPLGTDHRLGIFGTGVKIAFELIAGVSSMDGIHEIQESHAPDFLGVRPVRLQSEPRRLRFQVAHGFGRDPIPFASLRILRILGLNRGQGGGHGIGRAIVFEPVIDGESGLRVGIRTHHLVVFVVSVAWFVVPFHREPFIDQIWVMVLHGYFILNFPWGNRIQEMFRLFSHSSQFSNDDISRFRWLHEV
jgi:hypothetical protein